MKGKYVYVWVHGVMKNMFQTVVNLKTFSESMGQNTVSLLRKLRNEKSFPSLKIAVPVTRVHLGKEFENLISQHVDSVSFGAHTGHILMEDLISFGIKGSLLNHSEKRIPKPIIKSTIAKASELDFNLIICSKDLEETKEICQMGATVVAYEPPELIGGDISVAITKPHIIEQAVEICQSYGARLLVGAGIKTKKDVVISRELGASGILVSSGVVKAKDPFYALNSLMI